MLRINRSVCSILAVVTLLAVVDRTNGRRSFTIDYENDQFLLDSKPFRYVSGSLHYYNVPAPLWRDRLQKMKFGGLNAVQTYIEWSSIERKPGVYDFSGDNNITRFITEAQEEGLVVILRPSPFIDSERDMGGLPSWLLKANPKMKLRTADPTYIAAVDRWFQVLLPMLRPLLYANGGPVIMLQLENEFGSYQPQCATSGDYKAYLRDTFRKFLGDDVVLFTTDGCSDYFLQCGVIPDVFATCDFGSKDNVTEAFAALRRHQMNGPLVNSEYYSGWFDVWSTKHSMVPSETVAATLDEMLALNASVNIYMYIGGTHFGFSAGADDFPPFRPVSTSYDFDAVLSESGDLRQKFFAIKEVIKKYLPVDESKTIANASSKMELPPTTLERKASIFDVLPEPIYRKLPQSFEQLNHSHGFMLYSTNLTVQPTDPAILSIPDLHDRAQVFIDREYVGTLSATRQMLNTSFVASNNSRLDILVENQGRICYGQRINQGKGILSNVLLNDNQNQNYPLYGWQHYRLFDDWSLLLGRLPALRPTKLPYISSRTPSFFMGTFTLPDRADYPLDSFLQVTGWTKGVAFLNGHNLGRYWPLAGPQKTLYAPSVYFRPYPQTNSIVLFEVERNPCLVEGQCTVQFVSEHVINGSVPIEVAKPKHK